MQRIVVGGAAFTRTPRELSLLSQLGAETRIIQRPCQAEKENAEKGPRAAPMPLRCAGRPRFPRNAGRRRGASPFSGERRARLAHLPRCALLHVSPRPANAVAGRSVGARYRII